MLSGSGRSVSSILVVVVALGGSGGARKYMTSRHRVYIRLSFGTDGACINWELHSSDRPPVGQRALFC